MNFQANQMMAKLNKAQKEYEKQIKEFEDCEADFAYQNNAIVVTITGKMEIKKIKIDKTLIDPEDAITLEEMIAEAVNNAINEVNKERARIEDETMGPFKSIMGALGGGMGGMF